MTVARTKQEPSPTPLKIKLCLGLLGIPQPLDDSFDSSLRQGHLGHSQQSDCRNSSVHNASRTEERLANFGNVVRRHVVEADPGVRRDVDRQEQAHGLVQETVRRHHKVERSQDGEADGHVMVHARRQRARVRFEGRLARQGTSGGSGLEVAERGGEHGA